MYNLCGEKKFYIHKCILAASSPIFYEMFKNVSRKLSVMEFKDFPTNSIQEMLHFIYKGKLSNYSEENTKHVADRQEI